MIKKTIASIICFIFPLFSQAETIGVDIQGFARQFEGALASDPDFQALFYKDGIIDSTTKPYITATYLVDSSAEFAGGFRAVDQVEFEIGEISGVVPGESVFVLRSGNGTRVSLRAYMPTIPSDLEANGFYLSSIITLIYLDDVVEEDWPYLLINLEQYLASDKNIGTCILMPWRKETGEAGRIDFCGGGLTSLPARRLLIEAENVYECDSEGAALVNISSNYINRDEDPAVSYIWTLDGAEIGYGDKIATALPLGDNQLSLKLFSADGNEYLNSKAIKVEGTTAPSITLLTEALPRGSGNLSLAVDYEVVDTCDPSPRIDPILGIDATGGVSALINKRKIITEYGNGETMFSVTATDQSGNVSNETNIID